MEETRWPSSNKQTVTPFCETKLVRSDVLGVFVSPRFTTGDTDQRRGTGWGKKGKKKPPAPPAVSLPSEPHPPRSPRTPGSPRIRPEPRRRRGRARRAARGCRHRHRARPRSSARSRRLDWTRRRERRTPPTSRRRGEGAGVGVDDAGIGTRRRGPIGRRRRRDGRRQSPRQARGRRVPLRSLARGFPLQPRARQGQGRGAGGPGRDDRVPRARHRERDIAQRDVARRAKPPGSPTRIKASKPRIPAPSPPNATRTRGARR